MGVDPNTTQSLTGVSTPASAVVCECPFVAHLTRTALSHLTSAIIRQTQFVRPIDDSRGLAEGRGLLIIHHAWSKTRS